MKTLSKKLKRTLPKNIKMELIYTGTKLGSQFNIKYSIPNNDKHNIIYQTVSLEGNCNEDCFGECPREVGEKLKHHNNGNDRDKNS